MKKNLKKPYLIRGNCIGVFSPSCHVQKEDIAAAEKFVRDQGFEVIVHEQTFEKLNQSAGTPEQKINAFHDLISDKDVQMIIASRGGNRSFTMADQLDFDLIKNNPKIICGYSDFTFMLNAITAKTNLITFHSPVFRELPTHQDYSYMIDVLSGEQTSMDLSGCKAIREGEAKGKIYGGNLSVFQTLIGTPYMPDLNGAILMLEDAGDHLSRYDRMLGHLKNSGALKNLSALILGDFSDMQESENNPFGFDLKDLIAEHVQDYDYPVIMNAPFGHKEQNKTFPIGAMAKLKDGQLSFKAFA
ncbi:MAG: LD-carboxypeptidase [Pseudomonadota bacterium]